MPIDISPILANMRWQLAATLLLTILLIVSMGYQIKVLLHQHKIEKLRSDFVHTMIHELKRPVQTLKMCISIFGNDSNSEMTTIVKEEADNLTAYLAKLREVIRAEEHIPLSLKEFNVRQMIDSQASTFQRSHTDKDLHINVSCNLTNENVIGDKAQLANVVNNLLENSYKYSGESVNILVSCTNQGSDIALSVADDGIGIPQSEQPRVFEKFYRGQSFNGKMIPGIGLGLSFVRMIAEAHGGKATLESREDVGTKVTVIIPQK